MSNIKKVSPQKIAELLEYLRQNSDQLKIETRKKMQERRHFATLPYSSSELAKMVRENKKAKAMHERSSHKRASHS
jgi:hypothetical protein